MSLELNPQQIKVNKHEKNTHSCLQAKHDNGTVALC